MKKVKIIATLGPSTDSREGILKLAEEGVDIFRLNFSHYSTEKGLEVLSEIRRAEKTLKRPFAVFGDLVGPKIRIGTVEGSPEIKAGDMLRIVKRQVTGSASEISLNYSAILDYLTKGAEIYLADGLIKLEVERVRPGRVDAIVRTGGALRSRMGFSAHGLALSKFVLTPTDRTNIVAMAKAGIDGLAVSFVQTAGDIDTVRKILPRGTDPMIIAKIETVSGFRNAEAILEKVDALMIARGDLGFSLPLAELPHVQKELINLAVRKSKPVITATQMLESMIKSSFPTRAEVTDVANAILDGTDAVMLSAETAVGAYPFEVIRTMRKIIEGAVAHIAPRNIASRNAEEAVSSAVVQMAERTDAKLIVTFTESGATARRIARERPPQPIIAVSPSGETVRRLCFSWGVYPMLGRREKLFLSLYEQARMIARNNPIRTLKKGEVFIVGAGMHTGKSGTANIAAIEKA
jgi:pyruvate kinase